MGTLQDFTSMPWFSTANQDPQSNSGQHCRAAFLNTNAKKLREHIDIISGNV
jgi:hypothetical protein